MALVLDIADALVTALQDAPFLADVPISRAWIPLYKPQDVKALTIYVIPPSIQTGRGDTRGAIAYRPSYWVCVMRPVTGKLQEQKPQVDEAVGLMEQIAAYLYTSGPDLLQVTNVEFDPLFNPELLDQGTFQGVLTVEVLSYLNTN